MFGSTTGRWCAAAAVVLAVVSTGAVAQGAPSPKGGTDGASLEGVWRGDGYQEYVTVRHGVLRSYEFSAADCLPGGLRLTAGRAPAGGGVPFRDEAGVRGLTLRTAGKDNIRLASAGSVGERRLERIAALPADCTRTPSTDPVHTFDVFWATLRENYPFFRAKGVDWDAMRATYRPQVHKNTSSDRLFEILSKMIEPLHDMHTQLRDVAGKRGTMNMRPGTPYPEDVKKFLARVEAASKPQLASEIEQFAGGKIQYADLKERGVGYLRITGFSGYGKDWDADADAEVLDRALAEIFTAERVRGMRGLVVDLRANGGGSDALGIKVAARLTDRTYTAYTKVARNDPADEGSWTAPQAIRVHPAKGPRFTGPVAVLGGPLTISAGESFTQALMSRTPAPIRIGEPTQGVFSDVMERDLPNGWVLTVPNEKFLTARGTTYDGAGIPPTHREPVYAEADVTRLRDPGLKRAARELGRRGR
ncbi:S41 family peptidase [Streptomyces sp. NBC_00237]|uniref:S41 family peptidase n=1 Tax=Streptomyces sp. NBC_00237 TaxID=2975687 RepID=UPI0022526AD2|nr:S41 family peptidase [Streptomyces sp. NBC_00237]MCX5205170.1 S41 family peptidase [Streptomyces sp. NBC_00237]